MTICPTGTVFKLNYMSSPEDLNNFFDNIVIILSTLEIIACVITMGKDTK